MDTYGYVWIFLYIIYIHPHHILIDGLIMINPNSIPIQLHMYMFDPCESILVVNKTKDNIVEWYPESE